MKDICTLFGAVWFVLTLGAVLFYGVLGALILFGGLSLIVYALVKANLQYQAQSAHDRMCVLYADTIRELKIKKSIADKTYAILAKYEGGRGGNLSDEQKAIIAEAQQIALDIRLNEESIAEYQQQLDAIKGSQLNEKALRAIDLSARLSGVATFLMPVAPLIILAISRIKSR